MIHIKEPHLFEAVYSAVNRSLEKGTAPTVYLFPRQDELVRSVDRKWLKHDYTTHFDPKKVSQCIMVREDEDGRRPLWWRETKTAEESLSVHPTVIPVRHPGVTSLEVDSMLPVIQLQFSLNVCITQSRLMWYMR